MDFALTDEHVLLRDMVRDFVARQVAPLAAERDREAAFPDRELAAAAGLGLCGMMVPEDYGGTPLGALGAAVVYEELAYGSPALSVTLSVHNSLVCGGIAAYGSSELKQRLLPGLATGELLGAYALTEPQAGSDAAAITTRAVRENDEFVLTGRKIFVTSGGHAGIFIVFAVTDPVARTSRRISAFVVERGTPGLEIPRKERKLGLRASEIVELSLRAVRVPAGNLLGSVGQGFGIAMHLLDGGRVGIGAQSLGIARSAYDRARHYALEREQFGQPIAAFQANAWKLADMATRIEAARMLVWRAACLRDAGAPHTLEASQAKLFASEAATQVTDQAVQIHGGYGYLEDYEVERYFRDARATVIYEGTSEIQRLVIARQVLGEHR
ncbi:MAG TPA: acyl-CoA dehydrogenase family protein [Thermomicrobiaceae bacterium]|nr:acyl-CoA dehydrogenase family protein [Thermomicrobiaceae bacterium]